MSAADNHKPDTESLQLKSVDDSVNEIDSTISFLKDSVAHDMDRRVWQWEFNTFRDSTVLTILKDQGVTMGTQFMLPVTINFRNTRMLSGKCENSYFHDKFKGKGLFEKLFNKAVEEASRKSMKLLWAFTPATKVYEKKLGFTVFLESMHTFRGDIGRPVMAYFSKYSNNVAKNAMKYAWHSLRFISFSRKYKTFRNEIKYNESLKQYSIRDSLNRPEDMSVLYEKLRSGHPDLIHIDIDKSYLDWRISNNVNLQYITKYFYVQGELAGYYIFAKKGFSANITDFTYANKELAEIMFCHLLGEILRLGMKEFHYFGNIENELNGQTFGLFQKFGGTITRTTDMPFVFKLYEKSDPASDNKFLDVPKNWYLNGLWTEGFSF